MSNVWATMPCVQLSHNMLVNCIDNRQNQLFSEMSLRDVMELPIYEDVRFSVISITRGCVGVEFPEKSVTVVTVKWAILFLYLMQFHMMIRGSEKMAR